MKTQTQKKTPASSFLPPREIVQITPRISADLKRKVEAASRHLGITMNDFVESSLRSYLNELNQEGVLRPEGS
jgi:hypothetical protein